MAAQDQASKAAPPTRPAQQPFHEADAQRLSAEPATPSVSDASAVSVAGPPRATC